jgi:hypothetical protein
MKIRKFMTIIGVLAIITWLAVPAARIWRDPTLRLHRHTLGNPDPAKRTTLVLESPTQSKLQSITFGVLTVDHRATFWERYRTMLLGQPWPPGEGCLDWKSYQQKFRPEESKDEHKFESSIEVDRVTIRM